MAHWQGERRKTRCERDCTGPDGLDVVVLFDGLNRAAHPMPKCGQPPVSSPPWKRVSATYFKLATQFVKLSTKMWE
jgi:hypothetical protein